jgi:uncharacterized membrane protein
MKIFLNCAILLAMMTITVNSFAHEHDAINDSIVQSTKTISHDSIMIQEMKQHEEMKAIDAFPNYHPLIVHFPIVLLIIASLIQLFSFFIFKNELSWVALVLLTLGVLTAWLSSNTFHAHPEELTGRASEIFKTHEQMASLTWWFSLFALLFKIVSRFIVKRNLWMEILASGFLIISTITVSIAAHHGAMLVHMEGIGPKGNHLETHEHDDHD